MSFHERLKELRTESGMSQKEFAASLNVSPSKYNKWENGVNAPDFETISGLAAHFNVSVDYLFGRTPYRNQEEINNLNDTDFFDEHDALYAINVSKEIVNLSRDILQTYDDYDAGLENDLLNNFVRTLRIVVECYRDEFLPTFKACKSAIKGGDPDAAVSEYINRTYRLCMNNVNLFSEQTTEAVDSLGKRVGRELSEKYGDDRISRMFPNE